jgi:hypothetical protein
MSDQTRDDEINKLSKVPRVATSAFDFEVARKTTMLVDSCVSVAVYEMRKEIIQLLKIRPSRLLVVESSKMCLRGIMDVM